MKSILIAVYVMLALAMLALAQNGKPNSYTTLMEYEGFVPNSATDLVAPIGWRRNVRDNREDLRKIHLRVSDGARLHRVRQHDRDATCGSHRYWRRALVLFCGVRGECLRLVEGTVICAASRK